MEYVSFAEPSALSLAQSVLAIPMKRFEQPLVGFLSREHIEAILAAPDVRTWTGQRDHVMLATLYNTGARVSELIGMRVSDLMLGPTTWVLIHGKGRKERSVPLWPDTARELKSLASAISPNIRTAISRAGRRFAYAHRLHRPA